METTWDGQQGIERGPPPGGQYLVLPARFKRFPIVQMAAKRWRNAPKKYARGFPGTSTRTVPGSHRETCLAKQFYRQARGGIHFQRGPGREAAVRGDEPVLLLEALEDAGDEETLFRRGLEVEQGILGPPVGEGLAEDEGVLAEPSQVVRNIGHWLRSG
jgi:hypothetical protein